MPAALEKVGLAPAVAALRTARRHREAIAGADAVLANGVMGWPVRHPRVAVVFHGNYAGYAKAIRSSVSSAEYVRTRYVHGGLMALGGALGHGRRGVAHRGRRDPALLRPAPGGRDRERHRPRLLRRRRRRRGAARATGCPTGPWCCSPAAWSTARATTSCASCRGCCRPARRWWSPARGRSSAPGVVNLGHQGPDAMRDLLAADVGLRPAHPPRGLAAIALIEAQDAGLPLVTCRQGHVAEMLEREPALRPTVIPRLEAPLLAERVRLLLEDRGPRRPGGRGRAPLRRRAPRRRRHGRPLRRPPARPRPVAAPEGGPCALLPAPRPAGRAVRGAS